jgi:hypothetical protein
MATLAVAPHQGRNGYFSLEKAADLSLSAAPPKHHQSGIRANLKKSEEMC